MKMNRRKALLGIGSLAVGSGAALGSGAFTQVSADRTVNVSTAGDGSAQLQFSAGSSQFVDTSGSGNNSESVLVIELSSLNDNATTTIAPAFTITNTLDTGVGVRIRSNGYDDSELSGLTIESNTNNQNLASYPTASSDDHYLGSGGSVGVDLEIDTGSLSADDLKTITIEAKTNANQESNP